MTKRFFIILSMVLGGMFLSNQKVIAQTGLVNLELQLEIFHPTGSQGSGQRNPTLLSISQDGHTLYMSNVGFDCVLRIIDDDDNVVYSTYVAASTNTVVLPSTLSGSYKIELLTSDYYFWGYILL